MQRFHGTGRLKSEDENRGRTLIRPTSWHLSLFHLIYVIPLVFAAEKQFYLQLFRMVGTPLMKIALVIGLLLNTRLRRSSRVASQLFDREHSKP